MLQNVHICCLVLGLLLLVASVTHVQGAEETIYARYGYLTIRSTSSGSECKLTLPDKTVCHYNYGSATTPPSSSSCDSTGSTHSYCYFEVIVMNETLSGVYTLEYKMVDGNTTEDTFYVYLHADGFPKDKIQVAENEYIYLLLRNLFGKENATKCEVVGPNNTYEILLDSSWESPNYWGKEDECGFKVGVSVNDTGNWTLHKFTSGGAYLYAHFEVEVIPLDEINPGLDSLEIWYSGEQEILSVTPTQHTKYCEIWNPKKELVQRACSYTQNIVTDADKGNWTVVLGTDGKLTEETLVQYIIVITRYFRATVSDSERFKDGKILLCDIDLRITDCRFTRPDGEVLRPSEGIGNADYSYFGDGFSIGDCGLTIHNVQEKDKGMWKCSVSDGSTQWSGLLNVSSEPSDIEVETHRTPVVAQEGSEFQLSCSATRQLEYCWFRHPSGVAFRFSTSNVTLDEPPRQYVYDDTLEQGVCTIRVLPANSSVDSGEWTCNLGVIGSPGEEYTKPITVGVSETEVVSLEREVVVSEDSAVLKCYSVPLGIPLEYCRFIRPDGKGFSVVQYNNPVLGRYRYEAEGLANGECGLRIVSDINEDEDVGKWTCVVRLQGRKHEGQDFITVKTNGGLSTGAIVGIVIGAVALLLVIG